ncbi:MAG TPA: MotA/TolQ/ExbB proton channel family protein [Bacteroidia bacterium]|nr:MotA/TolQ/ExbB proton channel family protein [Bacteroidia bacterium]
MYTLLQITSSAATQAVQTVTTAVADTSHQVASIAAPQAAALPPDSFNLLSMVMKGGPMMIPMGFLFILSIYVLIERLIVISKASKRNDGLLTGLQSLIKQGNLQSAKAMCQGQNTPEAFMLEKGISRIGQPVAEIREAMTEGASVQLGNLEKKLNILNITGRIAPMFGFIGTIIGVVKIFYEIALIGTVEISAISTGLYEKMISSASGLVVGVLAFVAYHWLNTKLDKLAHRMEETKMKFLDILNEPS